MKDINYWTGWVFLYPIRLICWIAIGIIVVAIPSEYKRLYDK